MNSTYLILMILFGSISMGYITYGKKQRKGVAFVAGVGLLLLPYVDVSNTVLGSIGAVLIVLPFLFRV